MTTAKVLHEPYSPLFCLGFVAALEGALLWICFESHWISFYPKQAHAQLMLFGFLTAFISGFLMTAVPRMTGSEKSKRSELMVAALLIVLQGVLNALNLTSSSVAVFVLQILLLVGFFARRLKDRGQIPEGFAFIPFAFLSALLGPTVYLFSRMNVGDINEPTHWLFLWSGQAFVLNLICGLGSRLIPVLSRLPSALPMAAKSVKPNFKKMWLLAVLLNSTFVIEVIGASRLGFLLRSLWVLWFSVSSLGILKAPNTRSNLGMALKAGVIFIFTGYFLAALFPEKELHFLHLVFIGGFTLITFMVATRVVLAHGGQSTEIEIASPAIIAIAALFLLSGLARAFVFPMQWQQGVWLTVVAFLFASSLWMLFFGKYTYHS
jgi:uncharacterized protein involved in response to NO